MKKFLIKLTIFLGVSVLADVACGLVMDSLFVHAKSGISRRIAHITEDTNEDILIFGSSRAVHHYIPSIAEDSLGVSCYNCGFDSNGILLFYGFYQMISVRYTPKGLIYDIQADYDFLKDADNVRYLGNLRPLYPQREHQVIRC